MAYIRKTRDVYDVLGKYAGGWEVVTAASTRAEARGYLRDYRANEPGTEFRIKKSRERINK